MIMPQWALRAMDPKIRLDRIAAVMLLFYRESKMRDVSI